MRFAVSAIALLACTSLAHAADLGGPYGYDGSLKDAPSATAPIWTGLYIGAHGGYAWADVDYPGANPYVAPPAPCGDCGPPRASLEGGLVGGQLGYNFQIGQVVLGAEVDYSFAKLSKSVRDGNYLVQTHEMDGIGSVRGRLGYAFDRFLPYVTGGWAWADASLAQSCPQAAAVPADINSHCKRADMYNVKDSSTTDGWVIGGGFEYAAASNWTVRAEYLHYDFGKAKYELGKAPLNPTEDIGTKTLEHDVDVFRVGVNYKFGR